MILNSRMDASFLPEGSLTLVKDGARFRVNVDGAYSAAAAQCIVDHGITKEFYTQAQVIAEAINCFQWDIGRNAICSAVSDKTSYNESDERRRPQPERPRTEEPLTPIGARLGRFAL